MVVVEEGRDQVVTMVGLRNKERKVRRANSWKKRFSPRGVTWLVRKILSSFSRLLLQHHCHWAAVLDTTGNLDLDLFVCLFDDFQAFSFLLSLEIWSIWPTCLFVLCLTGARHPFHPEQVLLHSQQDHDSAPPPPSALKDLGGGRGLWSPWSWPRSLGWSSTPCSGWHPLRGLLLSRLKGNPEDLLLCSMHANERGLDHSHFSLTQLELAEDLSQGLGRCFPSWAPLSEKWGQGTHPGPHSAWGCNAHSGATDPHEHAEENPWSRPAQWYYCTAQ